MPLGKTLKALRQKQSLNQKALSALSGVSQATISRLETGKVLQLRSSALKRLADVLGVTVDFLMSDREVFAEIPDSATQGTGVFPSTREDRFRQIADFLDAFAIHDQDHTLYVNQTFAKLLGYSKEELLGKNGIDLVTAPQSKILVQRMLSTLSGEPCEALFVRRDGSVFPVEIETRSIGETIYLTIVHDISFRRCQQAVLRVHQVGLEVEKMDDLIKVVRIMCDELEDMGISFEAFGLNFIDEQSDRYFVYTAYPESRGYRTFQDRHSLQEFLERHAAIRGLISHWRRNKVWDREADDEYLQMMRQSSMGTSFHPALVVDVPFAQGTLFMGLSAKSTTRTEDLVSLLSALSQPAACILKRLQEIESLTEQLQEIRKELQQVQV